MKKSLITFIIVLFVLAGSASAASTIWTGTNSSAWDDAGNWSAGIPTALLEARIDDASVPNFLTIQAGDDAQCERLTVRISGQVYMTGGSVTMNGASGRWRVGWRSGDDSYMEVTGGTINTNYTLQMCEDLGAAGILIFENATANIGRGIDVGTSTGGTATFTMNSGTFTAANNGDIYSSQVGAAGTLNMNGGLLALQALLTVRDGGVVNLGGGSIEATGLSLSSSGNMDITQGLLLLSGDHQSAVEGYILSSQLMGYGDPGNVQYYFDDYTTSVWAVPEPATFILLGIGGLFIRRLRRK